MKISACLFMWSEMWPPPSDLSESMEGMESRLSKSTFFLHSLAYNVNSLEKSKVKEVVLLQENRQ